MVCYFAQFFPEEADNETWNVSFPDLPGCLTCGRGLKQAMANAIDALSGSLSIARTEGIEIADPSDMATAISKAKVEMEEAGVIASQGVIYLLVPAWLDI